MCYNEVMIEVCQRLDIIIDISLYFIYRQEDIHMGAGKRYKLISVDMTKATDLNSGETNSTGLNIRDFDRIENAQAVMVKEYNEAIIDDAEKTFLTETNAMISSTSRNIYHSWQIIAV